ncbi:MAG: UDP-N-acetylmuramoyl-L-alanine--D-glutamate ligase [gamma proteobacterium symbiont of Bathyaustriella thionipta]|nr:UDP-N-acetylmuramoyl-L-alanine--D-glutamate ligase [gamma proteobacterium symbiont of Bathyaustriella thionipta]MCU7949315.1 UDP-N-acetylmuramoyl-L-alanine--D-glutamate ligase [gamma proteobacterium symbiont of Bathyaustriella thionipta]MCU7953381.1 UDP-N-acetylmuramoyl-L-alanine--D-glutamate ligase [gamma proteobacterium symbiont of Bathyaustriella thionipta]MCU7955900.1 UDP-N-acetylmuramoyl-L-alanine--D-glutamate ligase [gamma proteobacterium symbiont of Bathyaustriella thionipta]MCU796731
MNKRTQNKSFDFNITTLIVGMGSTGLSCARYLKKRNCQFAIADSRQEPPELDSVKNEFNKSLIMTGEFERELFKDYKQIIVSPGISIRSKLFISLQEQGCLIIGDIELFAQVVKKPVIAITGSNGKSTVTTLVEKIAQDCDIKAIAGGNLGIPALDLLETQSDLYILELSSFQLETTYSLKTISATVLNVSEDHMDRYTGLDDYRQVKERIYNNTENAVVNYQETITLERLKQRMNTEAFSIILFGEKLSPAQDLEYELLEGEVLTQAHKKILQAKNIKLKGKYNYLNVLAALALLKPLQLDLKKQIQSIKEYSGLPHRCEWVDSVNGIDFYNDSKGTNTGATIAAIDGFEVDAFLEHEKRSVILIAGGVGKDADFKELGETIEKKIKFTILMGVDATQIKASALSAGAKNDEFYMVSSMYEAVFTAKKLADSGDVVLFSPACASFDMYQNYMKRGEDFKEKVLALKGELTNVS